MGDMIKYSVVIPTRDLNVYDTIKTLSLQTISPIEIIVVHDTQNKGANYCRNKGFSLVRSDFVLFSDDDILWEKDAIENLYKALQEDINASYAYGSYIMDNKIYCNQPFNKELLLKRNYISTMSLIKTKDFMEFDEHIQRLQDWDLWLSMLSEDKYGIYCGKQIFTTFIRKGITYNNEFTWKDAVTVIKQKHNI